MKHIIKRIDNRRVKDADISPGDIIEDDNKLYIAHSRGNRHCDECAFSEKTGYCPVNVYGGHGDKICQTDHGSLIFKGLISILEDL